MVGAHLAMATETGFRLLCHNLAGLLPGVQLVATGTDCIPQVVRAAAESDLWRGILLILVAVQAGDQLRLPARSMGPNAEVDQWRLADATVRTRNMKTTRTVTGFASMDAVWRVGIAAITMRA